MDLIKRVKASHRFEVGDKVEFTLGRNTTYETDVVGTIYAVIPYGFAAFYVIEYHAVVDHTLHMEYSSLVREVP